MTSLYLSVFIFFSTAVMADQYPGSWNEADYAAKAQEARSAGDLLIGAPGCRQQVSVRNDYDLYDSCASRSLAKYREEVKLSVAGRVKKDGLPAHAELAPADVDRLARLRQSEAEAHILYSFLKTNGCAGFEPDSSACHSSSAPCEQRNACIAGLKNSQANIEEAKTKYTATLDQAVAKLAMKAEAAKPGMATKSMIKQRQARTLAEILNKNVSLEHGTSLLRFKGCLGEQKLAIAKSEKEPCTFVAQDVDCSTDLKDLTFSEEKTSYTVREFNEGFPVKADPGQGHDLQNATDRKELANTCRAQRVPEVFNASCVQTLAVYGTFESPGSVQLLSKSGKNLTVYAKGGKDFSVFNCLDRHAFNMPVDEMSEAGVQMAGDKGASH